MLVRILTLFLFSFSINDVGVSGEVSLYAPTHIAVDVQRDVLVLECTFTTSESSVPVVQIDWARRKELEARFTLIAQTPIASGGEPVYRDSSLRRRANSSVENHEDGNITVSLSIPPECEDTAMYRCTVVLKSGPPSAEKVINVTILENPQIVSLGQPRLFECVAAVGIPAGELTWVMVRRIGTHLENLTMGGMITQRPFSSHCSRLIVSRLSTETTADDETIICMVTRDGQVMDKKEMPIRMPYAVKNVAITSTVQGRLTARPEISAYEGQVVVLNCSARGRPNPSFKWRHWVDSEEKWIWLNSSAQHSFVMQNVDNSKAGKYVCIAENFVRGAKHSHSSDIYLRVKRRLADDTPRAMESPQKVTMIIVFVAVIVVILCIGVCVIVFVGKRKRREKKRRKPIYNVEMEYRPIVRNSTRRSFSVPPPLLANDDFMI